MKKKGEKCCEVKRKVGSSIHERIKNQDKVMEDTDISFRQIDFVFLSVIVFVEEGT